jgi:hypothetical protein
MRRRAKAILVSLLFFAGICSFVSAQVLIKTAPTGKPTAVRDEANNWSPPILVYSDPDLEIYVPDITTPKWLLSHGRNFRETGTYPISLYSYYKSERACRKDIIPAGHVTDPRWLEACSELRYKVQDIVVDTRKKRITIVQTMLLGSDANYHRETTLSTNTTVSFSSVHDSLAKAVNDTTAIVAKVSNGNKGP